MCLAHLPVDSSDSLLPPWTPFFLSLPVSLRSQASGHLSSKLENLLFQSLGSLFMNSVSRNRDGRVVTCIFQHKRGLPHPPEWICKAIWKLAVWHSMLEIQSLLYPNVAPESSNVYWENPPALCLSVLGLCTSILAHKMPNCALTKGCSMACFSTTVLIQM